MNRALPTAAQAKKQAKALRKVLTEQGMEIGHASALERVAHDYGFRDWNAFHAVIKDRPPANWVPGGRVKGRYLSQQFSATVVSSRMIRSGWFQLSLDLDDAVDVVTHDSFSNFRKRVPCTVGPAGRTLEKTSDGTPHVVLDM